MKNLTAILLIGIQFGYAQSDTALERTEAENESLRKSEMRRFESNQLEGVQSVQYTNASANFDIHHVSLALYIDPSVRYLQGKATCSFQIIEKSDSLVLDLHNALRVDSILFRGSKISFVRSATHGLHMRLPVPLEKNTQDSVLIFYQGIPPGNNAGAFFQGTHAGVPVVWTLSEPYGSREWWPCKNNLTDKIDSIDILISCPQQYQPSSNGLLISNNLNGAQRMSHFRHRYPIVPYLVAIAVTNYVINRDTVKVGNTAYDYLSFAYPENASTFFENEKWSKIAFRLFTSLFGNYPFASEKYGHTEWGWGGGMEHQTNSFQINTSPNLSAHELAHHWFGDKITCASWKDIWLNEGFATYCSVLYMEATNKPLFYGQLRSLINNVTSSPSGAVYVDDTTSVSRIFSGRLSYNKGSYVLHMLRWVLGDNVFFQGVRNYLNDPKVAHGFAFTEDLIRAMENTSGKNLRPFFNNWVYGQGFPSYKAACTQNANNWVKIKLSQTTSHNSVSFYSMPVEILLKGRNGEKRFVLGHNTNDQEFWVDPGFAVDSIFIDPDLWILSKEKTATIARTTSALNDIRIFPNPTTNGALIQFINPTDPAYEIAVYNAGGQTLIKKAYTSPGNDEIISLPLISLPKGIYVVNVTAKGAVRKTQRIILR